MAYFVPLGAVTEAPRWIVATNAYTFPFQHRVKPRGEPIEILYKNTV